MEISCLDRAPLFVLKSAHKNYKEVAENCLERLKEAGKDRNMVNLAQPIGDAKIPIVKRV